LERKGDKNLSSLLKRGRVEMGKNLCPVLLSQEGFPFKAILVKREVDDVGEKIGEIFFQEKDPDPLAFDLFSPIAEEMFCITVGVKDFCVDIRDNKSDLN
jgi:hypothetical protein